MKKALLMFLMQSALFAFGQDKLTIKEMIFRGSFDYKSKVVQKSTDGAFTRTLLKINEDKAGPMLKYVLLENDEKGATASSYILSKEEIKKEADLFKFSINSYDVIYNDEKIIKENQEAGEGKKIIIAMKYKEEVVDLSTQKENNSCDKPGGLESNCIDWYYQTWVDGVLVSEEYQYTTCLCDGGGGGGGGPMPPSTDPCADVNNTPLGEPSSEKLNISYTPISPEKKNGFYTWKCHTAGAWWFNSFESSVLSNDNEAHIWLFESLTHTNISAMNGHITTGLEANFILRNSTPNFVTQSTATMDLDYDVEVKCITASCNPKSHTYHASATFVSNSKKPWFTIPGIQEY